MHCTFALLKPQVSLRAPIASSVMAEASNIKSRGWWNPSESVIIRCHLPKSTPHQAYKWLKIIWKPCMTQMMVRNKLLIQLLYWWLFINKFRSKQYKHRVALLSIYISRRWIWRRGGWRNYSGSMAGSLLDCHQFVFWWERSRSAAVGFLWRVYPDVCAENCRRLPGDWPTSRVTAHDCRHRNSSKH